MPTKVNPFDECPVYETAHFVFSLVCEDDAEDLFICYSDPVTLAHMNNDNCGDKWRPQSPDALKFAWQKDYELRRFLRWSVKRKDSGKTVGTIEIAPLPWGRWFFGDEKPIGILRIDLLSVYETAALLSEIITLMATEIMEDFEVNQVVMKAPTDQPEKVCALLENEFVPTKIDILPFEDYYLKVNVEGKE